LLTAIYVLLESTVQLGLHFLPLIVALDTSVRIHSLEPQQLLLLTLFLTLEYVQPVIIALQVLPTLFNAPLELFLLLLETLMLAVAPLAQLVRIVRVLDCQQCKLLVLLGTIVQLALQLNTLLLFVLKVKDAQQDL